MTPFTYAEVGCTRPGASAPAGYHTHHREVVLGAGDTWGAAVLALKTWTMFDIDWVELAADGPPEPGSIATVTARVGPFQLANSCRIIETWDTPVHTGFSYGTLPGHAMSGEERFSVHLEGDTVRYEILAYSRPGTWLARLGLPVVRRMQWRFGTDSLAAMRRATQG